MCLFLLLAIKSKACPLGFMIVYLAWGDDGTGVCEHVSLCDLFLFSLCGRKEESVVLEMIRSSWLGVLLVSFRLWWGAFSFSTEARQGECGLASVLRCHSCGERRLALCA